MKRFLVLPFAFILTLISVCDTFAWGFFAHQRINRLAVFCLPEPMSAFFKRNIVYLTENAVNPDRRRNAVKGEAPKHFIDIDVYGDSILVIIMVYKISSSLFVSRIARSSL